MIDFLKTIKWEKLSTTGMVSIFLSLIIYLIVKFFDLGILSKLSEQSTVPLLFLIFCSVFLIAIILLSFSGKLGDKWYIVLIFSLVFFGIIYLVWTLLDNRPKAKTFQVWVKEYKTAKPLDNVQFEIPHGEKGISRLGLIRFNYFGSSDTSFKMTLSKEGYETENKEANNRDEFTLKPKMTKQ